MIVQKHIFVYMNDEICMGMQILIFILIDLSYKCIYMQVLSSDIIGTLSFKEIISLNEHQLHFLLCVFLSNYLK